MQQMQQTLKLVERLSSESRELVRILRNEAEDFPGTAKRIKGTLGDTQELVEQVQSHWLLRGTRQEPASSQQVTPPSIRGGGF